MNGKASEAVFKSIIIDDVVSKSAQATQPQRKSSHKFQRPSINQHSMLSNKITLKLQIEERHNNQEFYTHDESKMNVCSFSEVELLIFFPKPNPIQEQ
mmetsp:Transcript_14720/g.42399  ORF Transcript_14720/g.42399 Transcript_14720/m.42399 type:complete len:98 (-) Transcript_14720:400-693(-)